MQTRAYACVQIPQSACLRLHVVTHDWQLCHWCAKFTHREGKRKCRHEQWTAFSPHELLGLRTSFFCNLIMFHVGRACQTMRWECVTLCSGFYACTIRRVWAFIWSHSLWPVTYANSSELRPHIPPSSLRNKLFTEGKRHGCKNTQDQNSHHLH